jgi:hypothetical protein
VQLLGRVLHGSSGLADAVPEALGAARWWRRADGQVEAEPAATITSSHVVVGRDGAGWWAAADPRQTASVA